MEINTDFIDFESLIELVEEIENTSYTVLPGDLERIYSYIDLTSLNSTDNDSHISAFVKKAINMAHSGERKMEVGAICVYPNFAHLVKEEVKNSNIKVACVATAFPSGQTFQELKTKEVELAIEAGADEIDMVINRGDFLEGNLNKVYEEIALIKKSCGKAHLKVILETCELISPAAIATASILAMKAGADFIKTSTGKGKTGATLIAAAIMCTCIKHYYRDTGKQIGFKPAGGISDVQTALKYEQVVHEILGSKWLTPDLFRIGASSLANKVLGQLDPNLSNYY